ncbi:MAG: hypothetical protein HGB31_05165 [Erysipelotrichaceae bacterium]|nr:hypothetical protein [Erysipelotrichaceae bacterium]
MVPSDHVLVLSYYRSDYGLQALKESGDSDEIAIRKVETKLPRNAKVISKKLTVHATNRTLQVSVPGTLKEALEEAKFLISPPEIVKTGKLISPANSGVFGIGAKKAVYQVIVGQLSIAEAVFETPVDLTGCLGSSSMKQLVDALKGWYKDEASKVSYLFLPNKLCDECQKPLRMNPFKTPNHVYCENCANSYIGNTSWASALRSFNLYFGPGVPKDIIELADKIKKSDQ